jgi:hypothetical protein
MSILKTSAIGVIVLLIVTSATAQTTSVPINEPDYNKPRLFSDLPQRMDISVQLLEQLFALPVGNTVVQQLSTQLRIDGTIVSKSSVYDVNVKSVVIRCHNRAGALFTFTRTTDAQGNAQYLGRIMSALHGDAFEIVKDNGIYVMTKIGLYDLVNE